MIHHAVVIEADDRVVRLETLDEGGVASACLCTPLGDVRRCLQRRRQRRHESLSFVRYLLWREGRSCPSSSVQCCPDGLVLSEVLIYGYAEVGPEEINDVFHNGAHSSS